MKESTLGFVGVAFIQVSTLPYIFSALEGHKMPTLIPLYCLIIGLSICLWYSLRIRDKVFSVANGFGVFSNLFLLFVN
jgi:lipid-A-disaccharide synthase-like uncharacterized protein